MKVLGMDPGAKRCGYCILENGGKTIKFHGSGLIHFPLEEGESFQDYRMRLIAYWTKETDYLLKAFKPDLIVSEIVPGVGGGNFSKSGQSYLAHAQITTVHAIASANKCKVVQLSANTVKTRIGGANNATKVAVRNGVLRLMPELEYKKNEWTKEFDEPDSFAIALSYILFVAKT